MQRSVIAQTSRLSTLTRRVGRPPQVARTAFNLPQTSRPREQTRSDRLYSSLAQEELTKPKGFASLRFSHVFGGLAILGQHRKAIQVLQEALAFLDRYDPEQNGVLPATPSPVQFTLSDRTRSIGLAQKLGTLALHIADSTGKDKNADLAEMYLTRALNAMIRLGSGGGAQEKEDTKLVGRDFDFPQEGGKAQAQENIDVDGARLNMVTKKSMGITMEALADLYVRRGRHELANPLYVQAISTLLPTSPEEVKSAGKPPVQDRCQASKAWSQRALQLADQTLSETIPDEKLQAACERARIVTEFNLGMLSEMEADISQAVKYLQRAQTHARSIGFKDAAREATDSLLRLRQIERH
ncbi:hypothetical protein QFC21_002995 [Naganishia friedmannii]|uniref:Uncharacterized protein n=1 Tax=Naganishia friedmannii TaxID=89922 RepID=A0ACC2VT59_9TREE|nr:hypothetical protein QFC21_002995 [Naganishia friedmannii]